MAMDISRALMELLAAIIIQFTPVDSYLVKDRTWTWGDTQSRWYCLEPVRSGKDKVVFTLGIFEGEVRTKDSITFTAVKGKDGNYVWLEYKRDYEGSASKFQKPWKENSWHNGPEKKFFPSVWSNFKEDIKLLSTKKIIVDNVACEELTFGQGPLKLIIILGKPGIRAISLSETGKGMEDAENILKLENP